MIDLFRFGRQNWDTDPDLKVMVDRSVLDWGFDSQVLCFFGVQERT